ncbi:hypothetical protein CR513_29954, partial [Mucuna pruriens]
MADKLSLIFKLLGCFLCTFILFCTQEKEIEDPVGSGNAGTKKGTLHCVSGKDMLNEEIIDLVSPSPGSEERSDFSAKIWKSSEVERLEFETNLSPEITREEFEVCGVEEDMESGLNKEQVGNSQGGLHSAADVVALEEFGSHLVEEEVEKLGDQTNLLEDVCGIVKAGAETEKQEDNANNPEGSNRNDLSLLLVSPEEFGYPLVEGEIHKTDDCVCVHDAVHNVGDRRFEDDTMCLNTSTGAMDIDEKTNVTVEHFIDEVHLTSEVNSSDLNIHEMVVSGTTTRNADTCEARFVSSPKMSLSPASERMIGFSPKLLNNSETIVLQSGTSFSPETLKVDIEICDMKENIQIDVNKDQVGVLAAPNVMAMSDEDLVEVPFEEFGNHLLEGEVEKLGGKSNLEDVCENGKGRDEAVERGDHNSPQGSNMKDVNVLHASQEESGYPLVEEVQKSDDNIYDGGVYTLENSESEVDAKDTDGNNILTAEHFADDVSNVPSSFKYSDGTPDQFLRNCPLNEVKSSGLDVHQACFLNHLSAHADICEEELKSPQKIGPIADPEVNNLEASAIKAFQAGTYFDPSTLGDVVGTCNVKESMESDKMEIVEYSQEVLHTKNHVNLLQRSMEECNIHIVQGEVTGLFDNDVHDDACVNGGDDTNSPKRSNRADLNLLQVSLKEFGNPLVEGVHKLDEYICVHDALYNVSNGRSEVDTRCLDRSIGPINNDGKTNVTVEHFIDEVHSSTFEDSDGTPVQFLPNDSLNEVKSDLNIHEMVVSGIVIGNADTSETKSVSSRKISLSPTSKRMISSFSPKQLNNSDTKVLQSETIFFPETPRVDIGICDVEGNMQTDVNKEQVDDNQQVIHASSVVMVLNNEDLVQVASVEVGDHLLEGEVEKSGLVADSDECIGFFPNNLEPSATKAFQAETYFDPSTLGDVVVATCNMEESMESDQMEKEYSQEVLHMANELVLLQRSMEEGNSVEEVTRLLDNNDDQEDAGGTGAEEEDKIQHYIKGDMDSFEKLLYEFQSFDDASGQNSDECPPTMPQPGEMKPCTINLQQISASGKVLVLQNVLKIRPAKPLIQGTFQEKMVLATPPKCTPMTSSEDSIIFYPNLFESSMKKELKVVSRMPVKRARDVLGTSDMKENIKIAKKEQVGSIISKSAFPKRQPLQDLQQN